MDELDFFPSESLHFPRLRPTVVVQGHEDRLRFLSFSELRESEFEVKPFVHDLVKLLDGSHSLMDLLDHLRTTYSHDLSLDDLTDVIELLAWHGLLDRSVGGKAVGEMFTRQARFFGEFVSSYPSLPADVCELQNSLGESKVLVIGAGGTGSWVIRALVASGVGAIDVVDPDVVELSNLSRQALYLSDDVGRLKAEVIGQRCGQLSELTQIHPMRKWIRESSDMEPLLDGVDLVICCADEPSVNVVSDIVADSCFPNGIAHMVGGSYGGNLGVPGITVIPGRTACWSCLRSEIKHDHETSDFSDVADRTGPVGSISMITGIVANLIAWDALRVLLGVPPALSDVVRELNIFTLEWRTRVIKRRKDCMCSGWHGCHG